MLGLPFVAKKKKVELSRVYPVYLYFRTESEKTVIEQYFRQVSVRKVNFAKGISHLTCCAFPSSAGKKILICAFSQQQQQWGRMRLQPCQWEKSCSTEAVRILERGTLEQTLDRQEFSINFAYTYGSFVCYKVCEEGGEASIHYAKRFFGKPLEEKVPFLCHPRKAIVVIVCFCNTFQLSKKL